MNIYIDESGSIDNDKPAGNDFIIALVLATDEDSLRRAYKRFVSAHMADFKANAKAPEKMFKKGKFRELKGSALSPEQKRDFVRFFSGKDDFELYYIVLENSRLSDKFCSDTSRAFNYSLYKALRDFCDSGKFRLAETCNLQLDERNEKPEDRTFLENYLNTQFIAHPLEEPFNVIYFDSFANKLVQLADVFANLYYSNSLTGAYADEFRLMQAKGILKGVYRVAGC